MARTYGGGLLDDGAVKASLHKTNQKDTFTAAFRVLLRLLLTTFNSLTFASQEALTTPTATVSHKLIDSTTNL